jgi:hypothetical protein
MPVSIIRPPSTSSIWLPSPFSAWHSHPLAHTSRTVPARICLNRPSSVPSHHQLTISSILPSRASSLHTQLPHSPRTSMHTRSPTLTCTSRTVPVRIRLLPSAALLQPPQVKLPHFITYTIYHTKLHSSVTFTALVFLQCLKAHFPTARGSSGHCLFVFAFMLA